MYAEFKAEFKARKMRNFNYMAKTMAKKIAIVVVGALLIAEFAIGGSSPAIAESARESVFSVQPPVWSVGDWWKYNLSVSIINNTPGGERVLISIILYNNVTAIRSISMGGHTYTVYEVTGEGSGEVEGEYSGFRFKGATTMETKEYFTETNYSRVKSIEYMNTTIFAVGEHREYVEKNYTPPMDELNFPIDLYENWTATSNVTTVHKIYQNFMGRSQTIWQNTTGVKKWNFTSVREEIVNVPAGTFNTILINRTEYNNTKWNYTNIHYSGRVGNIVKYFAWSEFKNVTTKTEGELVAYLLQIPEFTILLVPAGGLLAIFVVLKVRSKRRKE